MDYKELLKKGREKLPEAVFTAERFEIPPVKGHIEGNKTIISNFLQIADIINRDPKHVLKFILRELATPGDIKGNLLILGRKISASMINQKIAQYARQFVLCNECGKPDTKIIKEGELNFVKCLACGAKHPIRSKI
ncbi:translation initiation factor IF-2 subunit beta [Candidatus Woesearchaeota archaeon]|nr:translation initiation factor IF-2 subunit beta [Candidatus Woesearchaeota archaeon]